MEFILNSKRVGSSLLILLSKHCNGKKFKQHDIFLQNAYAFLPVASNLDLACTIETES